MNPQKSKSLTSQELSILLSKPYSYRPSSLYTQEITEILVHIYDTNTNHLFCMVNN